MTHGAVESAAADGARTSSIARTSQEARSGAEEAARASLANQDIDCITVQISIDSSDFAKPVGTPGSVEVTVSCRLNLGDWPSPASPDRGP